MAFSKTEYDRESLTTDGGLAATRFVARVDHEAEETDPYAMGFDCIDSIEEPLRPPECPFLNDSEAFRLWRKGFSDKLEMLIANFRKHRGLYAELPAHVKSGIL